MIVREATEVARCWVMQSAPGMEHILGAYIAGSASWMPEDASLPTTSDLDINLVLTERPPPDMREKVRYRGILLEISYLFADSLWPPERVLSDYHLAGGFRTRSIILDPSGRLTELQMAVQDGFARRHWVRQRCEHARERVLTQLAALHESAPLHDQVIGWLFPTGVTTHILLVAGLKNPTVRRRYVAVRELLAEYRQPEMYETLLGLLGCAEISRERVRHHLETLAEAFDAAAAALKSPFPFASDISEPGRPIAIDGSSDLIERGDHREAIFWMVVTYSRCLKVLDQDAPGMHRRFDPAYRELLGELGIRSFADIRRRASDVLALLPHIWAVADEIMAANPEIRD